MLRDTEAATSLCEPFEQYNRFASKFRCATAPAALFWEDRLQLNDGSSLVLRGANSALMIEHEDFQTRAEAIAAIADYIDGFYNVTRLHSSSGYIGPVEFELQLKSRREAA